MKPNTMLDTLTRGVLSGGDPGPLLDYCEENDVDVPALVRDGGLAIGWSIPGAHEGDMTAKPLAYLHLPWTVLREHRRLRGWERPEFDGAMMDGPDGPYTRRHTPQIDAVRGLIDRTEGIVPCPVCRGEGLAEYLGGYKEPCRRCYETPSDRSPTGRVPNPEAPLILELYALMLRDSGAPGEQLPDNGPIVDIAPGLLWIADKGLWPTRDLGGGSVRWHSDLAYSEGPPWVVPEVLIAAMPEFNAASGSESYFDTASEALHALALAVVQATVDCPNNDNHSWIDDDGHLRRVDCARCKGRGRVPYLETV